MPASPAPVGRNGPIPPFWNAVLQSVQQLQKQVQMLVSGQQNTIVTDANGNAVVLIGQLGQTVTIGASAGVPGVQVTTQLSGVGIAVCQQLEVTTITVTAGSRAATVANGTGLAVGMVIGAANVKDPSSGTATPAIVPGTTISAVSGTSVTLSQNAAETGSGLLCAACIWKSLQAAL